MFPEDDRVMETCGSVLSVLMKILYFLNNIYILFKKSKICAYVGVCN